MEIQIEAFLRGGQFRSLMELQLSAIKEKYGLKRAELEILYFLSQCGERNTATDIRRYLKMNKGHISQAIEHLCIKDYLIAGKDPADRRYVHYEITNKAGFVIREITNLWKQLTLQIFDGISEEELMLFKKVAYKIGNNMNRLLEEEFH